jgi:ribosome-associated translation inhibitor RaiA
MLTPLQIEFHHTHPTEPVETRVRQELAELEKYYNRLVSCRVDVEAPEHERRGSLCGVRIDFGLPPEDVPRADLEGLSEKDGARHIEVKAKHKDAAMAVHAAFNVARRRLKEVVIAPLKGT